MVRRLADVPRQSPAGGRHRQLQRRLRRLPPRPVAGGPGPRPQPLPDHRRRGRLPRLPGYVVFLVVAFRSAVAGGPHPRPAGRPRGAGRRAWYPRRARRLRHPQPVRRDVRPRNGGNRRPPAGVVVRVPRRRAPAHSTSILSRSLRESEDERSHDRSRTAGGRGGRTACPRVSAAQGSRRPPPRRSAPSAEERATGTGQPRTALLQRQDRPLLPARHRHPVRPLPLLGRPASPRSWRSCARSIRGSTPSPRSATSSPSPSAACAGSACWPTPAPASPSPS